MQNDKSWMDTYYKKAPDNAAVARVRASLQGLVGGCNDGVISKQAQRIKELESNVATLRLALMTIEDWNDHTVEERINIGAQGQKEHYREVASDALMKLNK